jgi:serine/threonine protein phosphatase 1
VDDPSLPPGQRVYAVGDIHGEADLLTSLLHAIREDSQRRAPAKVTLVFLGDFIDRGKDSAALLKVFSLVSDEAVKVLKGNHEAALVDVYRGDEEAMAFWLRYGGRPTLDGLGVGITADMAETLARLRATLDSGIVDWLDGLPHCWSLGDYYFTHAGIRPRVRLARQDPDDLLWIREPFLSSKRRYEKIIVHGHTVENGPPMLGGNRIGIDTGAHENGCLTALGLEGNAQWLIQASDGRTRTVSPTLG